MSIQIMENSMRILEIIIVINLAICISASLCYLSIDKIEAERVANENLISAEIADFKLKYPSAEVLKVVKEFDVE